MITTGLGWLCSHSTLHSLPAILQKKLLKLICALGRSPSCPVIAGINCWSGLGVGLYSTQRNSLRDNSEMDGRLWSPWPIFLLFFMSTSGRSGISFVQKWSVSEGSPPPRNLSLMHSVLYMSARIWDGFYSPPRLFFKKKATLPVLSLHLKGGMFSFPPP